jgi:hypothetical protein
MESRSSIPTLINNGPETVTVVMYDRYVAPTDKFSAQGRLHPKGIVLTPGEFTQFLPGPHQLMFTMQLIKQDFILI